MRFVIDLGHPPILLLLLLVAGHVLGDFLFQTHSMARRKREPRVLLAHTGIVFVTHLLAVLPFLGGTAPALARTVSLLAALGLAHGLIDLSKTRADGRLAEIHLFLLDQGAHAVTILGVWAAWLAWIGVSPSPASPESLLLLASATLLVTVYVLNGSAAATLIKLVLDRFPIVIKAANGDGAADVQRMGRTIGILERMLLLSLILLGQWEGVGWVFAGKTVARFRELDDRSFSEYYLIGTLSSLLFAAASGSAVRFLLTGAL